MVTGLKKTLRTFDMIRQSNMLQFVLVLVLTINCIKGDEEKTSDKIQCLPGPHHLKYAAPEAEPFTECQSWRKLACCKHSVVDEIKKYRIQSLYGDRWDLCGELSSECLRYYINEECFYQCDPNLYKYLITDTTGYVENIPICGSYCHEWFNACKHDKICVENVLEDYNWESGVNQCPNSSKCVTFAEMYGDARGICNKMWGDAFFYVDDTKGKDYCMKMQFDSDLDNPNNPDHPYWTNGGQHNWLRIGGIFCIVLGLFILW